MWDDSCIDKSVNLRSVEAVAVLGNASISRAGPVTAVTVSPEGDVLAAVHTWFHSPLGLQSRIQTVVANTGKLTSLDSNLVKTLEMPDEVLCVRVTYLVPSSSCLKLIDRGPDERARFRIPRASWQSRTRQLHRSGAAH